MQLKWHLSLVQFFHFVHALTVGHKKQDKFCLRDRANIIQCYSTAHECLCKNVSLFCPTAYVGCMSVTDRQMDRQTTLLHNLLQ